LEVNETLIFRTDLCKKLHVGSEAIRRWIKSGKLPPPDVKISMRTMAWKPSTLEAAGINL
jgi:predicted DNA-binding transcriptional regulator AlpA